MDYTKLRLKDFFSLERYKSVLVSLLRTLVVKLEGKNALVYEEPYIIEQYMFRLIQCKMCVNKGSCIHCGCSIPEKMWVREDYCSDGRWGPFMEKEEWEKHKLKYNLKFNVEYDFV